MIIKDEIYIKPFNLTRTLHIYMPDHLEENEKLPVLYMFDGHNLYYDNEATYGKSWGIKDYLDSHNGKVLVVGLECNHNGNERLSEFTPYPFYQEGYGHIPEKGRTLMKWMLEDLKPYIDNHYPVYTDRLHTYIGGSSMGGIMALYMIMMCSDTYSKAACISPHIYPMYKDLRNDWDVTMHKDTVVYISWGGNEYDTHQLFARVTDQNLQIIRALLKKPGVDVLPHVFKNDNHSEHSWEKELPVWMSELGILEKS